jgi:hypothetical protein
MTTKGTARRSRSGERWTSNCAIRAWKTPRPTHHAVDKTGWRDQPWQSPHRFRASPRTGECGHQAGPRRKARQSENLTMKSLHNEVPLAGASGTPNRSRKRSIAKIRCGVPGPGDHGAIWSRRAVPRSGIVPPRSPDDRPGSPGDAQSGSLRTKLKPAAKP